MVRRDGIGWNELRSLMTFINVVLAFMGSK